MDPYKTPPSSPRTSRCMTTVYSIGRTIRNTICPRSDVNDINWEDGRNTFSSGGHHPSECRAPIHPSIHHRFEKNKD